MPIEKPLPLMVGNKAYYSLTSYGPVEITVDVPYTTDEDIEFGVAMTVRDMGGTSADLDNPEWLAEHFDGMTSKEQVYQAMRREMAQTGERLGEEQKLGKCVDALSARLCQSVPPAHIEQTKQVIQMRFTQQLQAEGLTPDQFMARAHTSPAQLDAMFEQQARQAAEGDAALSAYAHEKKLKVDEHEYSRLLGIPADELQSVIDQARAAGQSDELHEAALRAKAAQIVVAECSCTYRHETPEEAQKRLAEYHRIEQMSAQDFAQDEDESNDQPEGDKTGFKLV